MSFSLKITDILGVAFLFFSFGWLLYGLYQVARVAGRRRGGIIIAAVALAGLAVFIIMAASTPARRAYIDIDLRGLFNAFIGFFLAFVLAATFSYLIYRLARTQTSAIHFGAMVAFGIAILAVPLIYFLYVSTFVPDLDEVFTQVETIKGIILTDQVPINIFENQIVKAPTAMELGPNGELYVAGASGSIWMMKDSNLDGVADEVDIFAEGLDQPEGLAWGNDGMYVNVQGKTIFLKDTDNDGKADEEQTIVSGFPGEVYAFHQNNGLTFGDDGRLYIGSGATTDRYDEVSPMAARIFSVNPDGTDLKVYATGTRNPFGLIPAPGGGFFAVDNGSSGCIDSDCTELTDVPEEVNYILEGKDYGFPKYYGMPPEDSGTMPPVVTFPEHAAPTGLCDL